MPESPTSPPNVLAVRFSSIGDVLLTTPLLRVIRRRHPAARVSLLTKPAYAPLLSDNPHLDRIITLEPGRTLPDLAAQLRAERFSHLLDLHHSLRSRMLRTLVPGRWRSYPKHRVARALLIHTKQNHYRERRPVPERYFAAARDLDVQPDGAPPEFFLGGNSRQDAEAWLAAAGLGRDRPLVAAAPGAAHPTKRWPAEHWRALLARAVDSGFDVVLVGGPEDAEPAAALAGHESGRIQSAAGVFGLQGTGALLRRARVAVSGDTGVMHMATGVGTPVVALYGPTVEAFGFFPYTPRAEVIELSLGCRPCTSQGSARCPLGHHRCMIEITPDSVYAALRRGVA